MSLKRRTVTFAEPPTARVIRVEVIGANLGRVLLRVSSHRKCRFDKVALDSDGQPTARALEEMTKAAHRHVDADLFTLSAAGRSYEPVGRRIPGGHEKGEKEGSPRLVIAAEPPPFRGERAMLTRRLKGKR